MGQFVAQCYYAKSFHKLCRNPYFVFVKDYHHANEKLKSSYKWLFLRWKLLVNWLFKGFSRQQIQEGWGFREKILNSLHPMPHLSPKKWVTFLQCLLQSLLTDSLWWVRADSPSYSNRSSLLQGWWYQTPTRSNNSLSWILNAHPLTSPCCCKFTPYTLMVLALGAAALWMWKPTEISSPWAPAQHAEGCGGCWYTGSVWGDGESWGERQRGGESVKIRQEAARGSFYFFNRAEIKHFQINCLCTLAERGPRFTASVSRSAHRGWPGQRTRSCGQS